MVSWFKCVLMLVVMSLASFGANAGVNVGVNAGAVSIIGDISEVVSGIHQVENQSEVLKKDSAEVSESGAYLAAALAYVVDVVNLVDNAHRSRLADSELSSVPVPVPAAALLFGSALLGFAGFSARRKIS